MAYTLHVPRRESGFMATNRALVMLLATTFLLALPSDAKKWTIYERQVKLNDEIAAGQKSGDLTLKEATTLHDDAEDISKSIAKMKDKNAGKLTYKDETNIEKRLNKLSL